MTNEHPMVVLMKRVGLSQMYKWFETAYDEEHAEEISKILGEPFYDDTIDEWLEYYYRLDALYEYFRCQKSLDHQKAVSLTCTSFMIWYEGKFGA